MYSVEEIIEIGDRNFDHGRKVATDISLRLLDELEKGDWTFEQVRKMLTNISANSSPVEADND